MDAPDPKRSRIMASPPNQTRETGTQDNLRGELKGDALRLKDTARTQAERKAEQQKESAAKTAHSASAAIDTAAEGLRQDADAPQWLASAFAGAARQVDDLANRLHDRSSRDIVAELSRFARQRPMAFLTASAAVGFAVARLARAGLDYQHEGEPEHDSSPYDDGVDATGLDPAGDAASQGADPRHHFSQQQPGARHEQR
jgi:hypothetical protein